MKLACHAQLFLQICVPLAVVVLLVLAKTIAGSVENAVIGDIREKWTDDSSEQQQQQAVLQQVNEQQQQLQQEQQAARQREWEQEKLLLFPVEQVDSSIAARHHHHQRQHKHHHKHQQHRQQQQHHRRGRLHLQSHYQALELEQRQQQLGKHAHRQHHASTLPRRTPAPPVVAAAPSHDYLDDEQEAEPVDYSNNHFDLESYQRYANIELPNSAAMARSGRHRGRHVTPHPSSSSSSSSNMHNLMLPLVSELSGKYLRSLPDSVDFPHDRLHGTQPQRHWPVKREAIVEGDVILGGLMMVHSREDSITCGPIMTQGGIQALEAMLFTIDRINEMDLLPNITLGAHILDDCDKDSYGLEMAVDFIKGELQEKD